MRSRLYRIHVNKLKMKSGAPDIWTIHGGGVCISASKVHVLVPAETSYEPQRKANPKAFMLIRGYLNDLGGGEFSITCAERT